MNIISTVYIVILPYLLLWDIFKIKNKTDIIIYGLLALLMCLLGAGACIICNLYSLRKLTDTQSALRNLAIKLCHIPAQLLILLITLGFMNPFLLLLSWLPLAVGVCLLVFDGSSNICACLTLKRRGKCSFKTALILGIFSFVYVGDIIAAIVQLVKSRGKKRKTLRY